jgi:DNA-binding PucR family transcriptional regulator
VIPVSTPPRRAANAQDGLEGADTLELVRTVAKRLRARVGEILDRINAGIEAQVPVLDNPESIGLMHASVDSNVSMVLHMLINDIPIEGIQPPSAVTEYAVKVARQGLAAADLRRSYHIGTEEMLDEVVQEIQQLDISQDSQLYLVRHIIGWWHRYVDWMTGVVLAEYEVERKAIEEQKATRVSRMVQRVLDQQAVDSGEFARTTGYRLDGIHVATVLWIDDADPVRDQAATLQSLASQLAKAVNSPRQPLILPVDGHTAWVWCRCRAKSTPATTAEVAAVLSDTPAARAAMGAPAAHAAGFRKSLQQANIVRVVASSSTAPHAHVISYSDDGTAVAAFLAHDLPATRRWVGEVLGGLAVATDPAARLRETLRIFLRTRSYRETSEALVVHRNTVKYRMAKAEEERGMPLTDRRLDLEVALHLCHIFGDIVLHEPEDTDSLGQTSGRTPPKRRDAPFGDSPQ